MMRSFGLRIKKIGPGVSHTIWSRPRRKVFFNRVSISLFIPFFSHKILVIQTMARSYSVKFPSYFVIRDIVAPVATIKIIRIL